eukprot:COSAG04_NODE_310_length_17225_cov_12.768014_12_plen_520_part_00
MTGVYFTNGCGGLDCGANGQCVGGLIGECVCEGNYIGQFCQTECGCSGHGSQTAIGDARGSGRCSAGSCACEGNFIGELCQTECPIPDCGAHGSVTGSIEDAREANSCWALGSCACDGNFIGQFCATECDCSGHGSQTAIEAAREANSCSAGSCACERGALGELCETYYPPIDLSTVPAQCVAGMGSHGVVYNGTAYRTLDDAPPEGGRHGARGAPNGGCQRGPNCTEYWPGTISHICHTYEPPNYLPLPLGYALAPPDADTIAVIAAHGWSAECAVAADGAAWYSANNNYYTPGGRCGSSNRLASSGGSYTVTHCIWDSRVLALCKDCEHGTYDAASSSCACEGNWAGPFCDRSCGEHGTSDGSSCICDGNFINRRHQYGESHHIIGEFCETECGCNGHGNQTAIEAARETGECAAGSCTCEGNWAGEFCQDSCGDHGTSDGSTCACDSGYLGEFCQYGPFQPLSNATAPAQCVAGMGSHGVVYNGTAYRTLDDAPPEGGGGGGRPQRRLPAHRLQLQ